MWRNGRRNGLKIRFRESEVWVRVPPSAPSGERSLEGKMTYFLRFLRQKRIWRELTRKTAF